MKKIEILSINLTKNIKLHLVISIQENANNIILINEKLNIRSIYEGINLEESKNKFAKFVIGSLIEYAEEKILEKVFSSSGIRLRPIDDAVKTINKQVKEIIKRDKALFTSQSDSISSSPIKEVVDNLDVIISDISKSTSWLAAQ